MERKSNKTKRPVPENLVGEFTQEEWGALPSYARYKIIKRGTSVGTVYDRNLKDLKVWTNNMIRRPIPENLSKEFTEEEWYALPSYLRYRYTKKGTSKSNRGGKVLPIPPDLEETFSREEWDNLSIFQRFEIKHRNSPKRSMRGIYLNHGISPEFYWEIFDKQEGKCAICNQVVLPRERTRSGKKFMYTPKLTVDHNHKCCEGATSCSNCFRGLLCNSCNWLLGQAKDDPQILRAAANYLENARQL